MAEREELGAREERKPRERREHREHREHDKHDRCRPHYGGLHDRVEAIRDLDFDEAIEVLKTIIDAAFYQGVACGCMRCKCENEHREEWDGEGERRRGE